MKPGTLSVKKTSMPEEVLRRYMPLNWQDRDVSVDPSQDSIKLIRASNITNHLPTHVHHKFYIGISDEGKRTMHYRGESSCMGKGNLFLINMDEPHECDDESHSFRIVGFGENAVAKIAGEINCKNARRGIAFNQVVAHDRFLFRAIASFFELTTVPASKLEIESSINGILSRLVLRHTCVGLVMAAKSLSFTAAVRLAKEYIHDNFAEDISLSELAVVSRLTPFHLSRIFTNTYGIPPHQYLMHVRIEAAKAALLRKGSTIADVAVGAGFYDHSHFAKVFKRYVGVSYKQFIVMHGPKTDKGNRI